VREHKDGWVRVWGRTVARFSAESDTAAVANETRALRGMRRVPPAQGDGSTPVPAARRTRCVAEMADARVRGLGQDVTMTVRARLDLAIFDAADIDKVGSFYAELTGWDVVRQDPDRFGVRTPDGQEVEFQRAPDHVAPRWPGQEHPQQVHLDLQTDDSQAAAERAVGLGATRLAEGPTWITMADPAGHPFDLCQADGVGPVMRLFAVTIDAPDASALARFYADLTGMEITYEGPEGALIAGDSRSLMFQQISDYSPPRWTACRRC
jgi:catechol 2,3-dioxygenase-like lactoylglutathione lyase family enzyme